MAKSSSFFFTYLLAPSTSSRPCKTLVASSDSFSKTPDLLIGRAKIFNSMLLGFELVFSKSILCFYSFAWILTSKKWVFKN